MAQKKYLSLDNLALYDEKIKGVIADGDSATLASAKGYADSLAGNYDGAGAAAAALTDAKSYTDTREAAVRDYIGEIDAELVDDGITSVIAYVDHKTDGIATDAAVTELGNKVTTLIGDDANKSVRTIANEELAAQLIADGAAESLDTLQEIAAWIQSHPDDASAMNKAIEDLTTYVGTLPEDAGASDVVGYVDDSIISAVDEEAQRVDSLLADKADKATTLAGYGITDAYNRGDIDTAIADAKTDASNKDAAVLAAAQQASAAVQTALDTHTDDTTIHVTAADKTTWNAALQAGDITSGSANGTIAVNGTDVAVKGLGSAAYADTTAFDAAGSATTALNNAKTYTDTAIANFVECTESEINALFTSEA